MTDSAVGVDIGGTKIAAALVDGFGEISGRTEIPSDLSGVEAVIECVAELVDGVSMDGVPVGVGVAGIVDHHRGLYRFGPNTGLPQFEIAQRITERTGRDVVIDNDANTAALAEYRLGAGVGAKCLLCATFGTGIGGGIVIGGDLMRGASGGAAEIGHILVDPAGPLCGCGRRGCWEQFASGSALVRRARAEISDRPDSSLHEAGETLTGPHVTAAARRGDAFAMDVVEGVARWMGVGLASLTNVLDPDVIVVAGGLVRDWDLVADVVEESMHEGIEASSRRPLPDLRPAHFSADAGLVGAAILAMDAAG